MRRVSARASLPRFARPSRRRWRRCLVPSSTSWRISRRGYRGPRRLPRHRFQGVHMIVSFLLERLPESTHLVISSRVDPPLPLARLRARGQMKAARRRSALHARGGGRFPGRRYGPGPISR